MIARKIERLDEVDRRLLVAASVQGHEFDSAVVAEAIEMDPADVEERLDALEHVHVFVKRMREHEFPDLTLSLQYQFVHVLYQNALYGIAPADAPCIAERPRRARARRAPRAVSMPRSQAGSRRCSNRRGTSAQSAQYFLAGAQHAVGLFAFREALSLAERGLSVLRGMPDGPERAAARAGTADDPRPGAADDPGVGEPGDRARLRPRPRAVPQARRLAAAVSRSLGDRAVPRNQRGSAGVPRAAPTS